MNLPDRAVLEKLLRGQLAPEVAEQLCLQLENERTFASVADEVMAADTFVDALKATSISTDPVPSLQLQSLIERFQSWDSSGVASGTVAAMSPTDPAVVMPNGPGEPTQIGHFRVISKLGQGGMGAVYLGQDLQLNRKAALKVMRPEVASHPESRERFLREARAAAAIEHDNIVAVWQVGEDNGSPFIAMPLLQGESLDDRLKREPKSGVDAILKLARETAQGLAAAHDAGLIHRDIKPANLWIEGDPTSPEADKAFRRVKILDFGLARASEDVQLTSTGAILGTPAFMSPEQGRGLPVDGRSDLFSLGVVLYRMATGKMPFTGDTMMALLTSLAVDTPAPPSLKNERIPSVLSDLILKLLQKEPADRFQSAREVVAAANAIEVAPNADTALLPAANFSVPPKSSKALWLGLGGAAMVLMMGIVVITITDKDGKVTKITAPDSSKIEIAVVPDKEPKAEPKKVEPKSVPAVVAGELPPLPKFAYAPIPWGESPFDKLDPKDIPNEERFNWQPKELVAVIGKHERRHWQGVNAVAISPDGKLAATASGGHPRDLLHIYDVETQKLKWTLRGSESRGLSGYSSVCFSPDGKRLLAGDRTRGYRLYLWDLTGDEPVETSFGSDLPAGEPLKDAGEWARFMEGGKTLLVPSSSTPRKVQLFDISGGKPVHKTKDFIVYRIKTATKGNRIVYTTPEGKLRWATVQNASFVEDAELAIPFQPGPENESLISLSDDGNTLMLWQKGHYELWNLAGAKPKKQSDIEPTQDLAQNHEPQLSSDGRHFVTIHSPKLWKVEGGEVKIVGGLNEGFPDTAQTAISPDGKRAVVGNSAGAVRFFDLSDGGAKELSPLVDPGVSRVGHYFMQYPTLLAKRGLIAVPIGGNSKGTRAQMWDLTGTKPRLWPDEKTSRVGRAGAYACPIEFVDPSEETALIHEDGRLGRSRWTPKGFETTTKMEANASTVLRQYRPSSGSTVLGNDKWENWRVWNVGEPIDDARTIRGLTSAIGYLEQPAFRPDRGLLAISLPRESVTGLWSPSGNEYVRTGTIPSHLERPQFSPDGRWLMATTAHQRYLHMYDLKDKVPVQILPVVGCHTSTFSADAKRFFYTDTSFSKLQCCELPTGRELWAIDLPEAPWWMQMAPDNRHLFLHNFNGTVYVLRLESPE